jgi:hypothetical protein
MAHRSMISISGTLLIILLLSACANGTQTPDPVGVDMRFREFYDLQGGSDLLGGPVSGTINEDGAQYQVLENAIMIYKSSAPAGEQFDFLPLAHNFVRQDDTPEGLAISGQTSLGGHIVYDEFSVMFNRMGGVRFVGHPLTEVRKNDEESRYEQYFEKLGFYRLFSDPVGKVHLLPYGLMECRKNTNLNCSGNFQNAIPHDLPPQPFLPILRRVGSLPGNPLSQVYLAPDGKFEQVYENVVLVFDPQNQRTIDFRPLPESVGFKQQPPVALRNDPGMTFWQTTEELGYNVPIAFLEYISAHGGTELSGQPISELFEINGLRRQCFTNYCLEYDSKAPKDQQIRPTSLGYEYLKQQGFSTPALQLRIWENLALIEPEKPQVVAVMVYNQTPNSPMQDIQPVLTVQEGNKPARQFTFPPTSAAGTSFIEIPGSKLPGIVTYEICVSWPGSDPVCAKDSWIVK